MYWDLGWMMNLVIGRRQTVSSLWNVDSQWRFLDYAAFRRYSLEWMYYTV